MQGPSCSHEAAGCSEHPLCPFAGSVVSSLAPVRLVDGPGRCAGRVEVFHEEEWGTVCDKSWDFAAASVVCRQLGCGMAVAAPRQARFGEGRGRIWLDDTRCTGTEAALSECRTKDWGVHLCQHKDDASVVCSGNQRPSRGWERRGRSRCGPSGRVGGVGGVFNSTCPYGRESL